MPFVSKSQQRKFYADPKLRPMAKEWAHATPNIKALPEKKEAPMEETKKAAAVLAIVRNLYKQADGATTSPAAPMQPLNAAQPAQPPMAQPGQPAQPPGPQQPRKSDQIAKEIGAIHPKHRGTAVYHRLQQRMPGSLRGYAAASQPAARENFTTALSSKEAEVEPQFDKVSPLVGGMLRACADANLNEAGTLTLLQKTAERQDDIGKDVRNFLDVCIYHVKSAGSMVVPPRGFAVGKAPSPAAIPGLPANVRGPAGKSPGFSEEFKNMLEQMRSRSGKPQKSVGSTGTFGNPDLRY